MEFSILGPLEVRAGDRAVMLGGIKPRALLALLVLHANEAVSAERLALGLWGEDAPAGAVKTVQVHVSRVRKALGDPEVLTTTPAGYRLRVREGELDADRFDAMVAAGREALGAGEAERAGASLREALGLWRGAPLADLADQPFAPDEIARLEENRLGAVELRVDADLETGRHAELVAELGRLTREHPWRERLHGQLMLALYRSGRQADALDAYRRARKVLVDELGIEPGAELRELHGRMLEHDPALDAPRAAPGAPLAPPAGAPPRASRLRRRRVVAGAVVLLVTVVAVAVVALGGDAGEGVRVPVNSVAVVDPATNRVTRAIDVDEGPGPITAGAGQVWVLNLDSETVARIDPRRRRLLETRGLGDSPANLAGSPAQVWVAAGCSLGGSPGELQQIFAGGVYTIGGDDVELAGVLPERGTPQQTPPGCGLATTDEAVVAATNVPPGIVRVDAGPEGAASEIRWRHRLPQAPAAIAVGAGAVWALDSGDEVVRRLDPRTGRPVAVVRAGTEPVALAIGAGSVWVANRGDGSVSRIDPRTNDVRRSISVGEGPLAVAASADAVWVSTSDGRLARIDPKTEKVVARVRLGHRSEGIALAAGRVFVSVR